LKVKPYLSDQPVGVFATRAPTRPNPMGMPVVGLLRREGNVLYVGDVDAVDCTPPLDIKPYVPTFDSRSAERMGWLEGVVHGAREARDDGRLSFQLCVGAHSRPQ